MKQRTIYLDNICGILLLHMIYTYHIANSICFKPFLICIIGATLSFFMSWFFFKGGMTHKDISTCALAKKSSKRLLLPYFSFLVIGFILDGIIKFTKDPGLLFVAFAKEEIATILTSSIVLPTAATWFLLSLFVVRITFNILYIRVHPLFMVVVFASAAYAIHIINSYKACYLVPNYLGNMCHGLSLYSLGYYLKEKQYNRKIFITAVLIFIVKFFLPAEIDFRSNLPTGHFMLAVLYGMSGCVVINYIFRKIAICEIPFVSHFGKDSMIYYLVHYPVIITTTSSFSNSCESMQLWLKFVLLSLIVTFSLILSEYIFRVKKIRFLIGG